jgi:ribonuclease Z
MLLGLWLLVAGAVVTTPVAQAPLAERTPQPARTIRVTLLGTGVGPPVNLQQYGPTTLVEAGGLRLLFDCGRGATLRLVQAGIPIGSVNRVFLTHLHSDHVVQLPDLFLTGWVGAAGRKVPLEVWGPQGTADMMTALEKAFAFDIHVRRDVDERLSAEGIRVRAHEVTEGVVLDEAGVKVTAFLVDHSPVAPAFGYRVDCAGRSVVLSGDTRPSDNLVKFAAGTDVLIHEAVDPVMLRARGVNPAVTERVIAHHTTGEQAGTIFARVRPRLAVYSHAPTSDSLITQTRRTYAGPLQGAEDLLTIDIGDQVIVRRHVAK